MPDEQTVPTLLDTIVRLERTIQGIEQAYAAQSEQLRAVTEERDTLRSSKAPKAAKAHKR